MSKFSDAARARSYRLERGLTGTTGVLALLAGAAAVVVGMGLLGEFRAQRPVADPIALDFLRQYPEVTKGVAIALGVLLFVLGLRWAFRSLRVELRPDLVLDRTAGNGLRVVSGAVAEAVRSDAEGIDGVAKARVRLVGDEQHPALRIRLSLTDGAEVRAVWQELDKVLGNAKSCLGVAELPTAVHLELATVERQRVQ
ncbi:hypothetical protein GCM10010174_51230 [Kutzneria viridogrisea]|uniref:Alkaline shock response membrane anchor protein AmaP n=1 Tax=Kutzneria viridogrisea TaxID=47990 RepID=A0ABR6BPG1_9PSEU|nr:hypothetical protein [Kutzneria viridogrisea]